MSRLSDLLKDTNNNIVQGWAFRTEDNGESFKLLKLDAIETEDEKIDEHVATIYVIEDFMQFLKDSK